MKKGNIKNKLLYKYIRSIFYKFKNFFISSKAKYFNYFIIKKGKTLNNSDSQIKNGYLYTAFGDSFYEECINSVKILKKHTKYPIFLFTDKKDIPKHERELFYGIRVVPGLHLRSKVDYIHLSPFENSIYLDTDIFLARGIDDLFELLQRYPLFASLDTARKRAIMSKKIREYREIPYAFGEVNTGLIGFNDFSKKNILAKWPDIFHKYINESGGWDQPSFRILLWKEKVNIYILPPEYNIRSKKLLERLKNSRDLLGEDHMAPRVYHMHVNEEIYKNKLLEVDEEKIIDYAEKNAYDINY